MNRAGSSTLVARVGGGLAVSLAGVAIVLHVLNPTSMSTDGAAGFIWPVPFLAMSLVGAVVGARKPRNPVGWLFLASGLAMGVQAVSQQYASYSFDLQRELPLVHASTWVALWVWAVSFAALPVIFTLFPTGRPTSKGWWTIVWASGLSAVAVPVAALPAWSLPSRELLDFALIEIPLANLTANGLLPLLLLASVVSAIVRFRGSVGAVRQQLKWLAFAGGLMALSFAVAVAVPTDRPMDHPLYRIAFLVASSAIPVGAGIAILRYRLYDIDRIISRTLAYAIVVAVLVGMYAGSVLGLSAAARAVTGESGDLVVALSTLVVAAAFQPVRGRVQSLVERRFNRRRYDAQATLEDFGRSLRDELDAAALVASLRSATTASLQPSLVSVHLVRGGV